MIIGIDPGAKGALAWLSGDGHLIAVQDLPWIKGHGLNAASFAAWIELRDDIRHAFVERVASRPGQGVVSVFTFGMNYGQIIGVLTGLKIPVTLIAPTKWKPAVGLPTGSNKAASRARAAQLWPGAADSFARVRDDGRAEAALIGMYGARTLSTGSK
jgi:crossover junction endodeoxyribonuclease RuvC